VPPDRPADDVRGGVVREDRQQGHEDQETPVARDVAEQHQVREPSTDPDDAEHRDGEPCDCVLAGARDEEHEQRGRDGGEDPGEHPGRPSELRAEERQEHADETAEHDRPEAAGDRVQLVQGEHPAGGGEAEEPPPAEPDGGDHGREQHRRDDDSRGGRAHPAARAPKRR
jgi:hypothetical protein